MINVKIDKKDSLIKKISVDGHSDYATYGYDIVCAAVSSVVIGLINAIDLLDDEAVFDISSSEEETGHITYRSIESTEKEQTILNAMIVSLEGVQQGYSNYIHIKMREVK